MPKNGKATIETIPCEIDKSRFSCERYKFFLDAPFEIGQQCCSVMKKYPAKDYAKKTDRKPITAMMASESRLRTQKWVQHGCNGFDMNFPMSMPMAFWMEQDVLHYIKENNVPVASVYGSVQRKETIDGQMHLEDFIAGCEAEELETTGVERTGCMFCLFGIHLEKEPNRLQRMKVTHPKQYEYIMKPESEGGLGYKEKIDWINEHGNMRIAY